MPIGSTRAETFAFFCGIAYFAFGLLGLVPQALVMAPSDAPKVDVTFLHGNLLGLFPVNAVHSAAHVGIGLWGILAGRSIASAKVYARVVAIFFGVLAVMGLIPGLNTVFGLLPLHGADIVLHGITAAIAAYFGWHPAASIERRAAARHDRREKTAPIAEERRSHHGDRRLPGSEV